MVELSCGARFLLEAVHSSGVVREGLGDQLDRNLAAETAVARAIDLAHAAGTQPSDDFVGADPGTDLAHVHFARSIMTISECSLIRSKTMRLPSGAMSNVVVVAGLASLVSLRDWKVVRSSSQKSCFPTEPCR